MSTPPFPSNLGSARKPGGALSACCQKPGARGHLAVRCSRSGKGLAMSALFHRWGHGPREGRNLLRHSCRGRTKSASLGGGLPQALSTGSCCLEAKPPAECQAEEGKPGFGPGWGVCGPANDHSVLLFYILMAPQFGFEDTTCFQLNTLW